MNPILRILPTALLLVAAPLFAAEDERAEKQVEQQQLSGNPVFEGWYADPEGIIFGDTYWIYPTYSA